MQVNLFFTRVEGALGNTLLVLPTSPSARIPADIRQGWVYYATTTSDDALFKKFGCTILEAELAERGFAMLEPRQGSAFAPLNAG